MDAALVLEDGTMFHGCFLGSRAYSEGEIVFTTAMTGYQETLAANRVLLITC